MSGDSRDPDKKTDADPAEMPGDEGEGQSEGIRPAKEIGGTDGPDPTRYGDWEKAGHCIDF